MDKHLLYQSSVQTPKKDLQFLHKVYLQYRHHKALVLREDFCGTAILSCEWIKSDVERFAIGVDIDKETIDWSFNYNVIPFNIQDRLLLLCADVLDIDNITYIPSILKDGDIDRMNYHQIYKDYLLKCSSSSIDGSDSNNSQQDDSLNQIDIICIFNFSINWIKNRNTMVKYFKSCLSSLNDQGMLVIDLYGGSDTTKRCKTVIDHGHFKHCFEQTDFNPITNEMICYIHFKSKKERIDKAFECDWRMWSVQEIRECMEDAGYKEIKIWWSKIDPNNPSEYHEVDETIDDNGVFQCPTWYVYIIALK